MPPWSSSTVWIDANGNRTITKINTTGGYTGFLGNLLSLSNAALDRYWESATSINLVPSPVAAAFQSVVDRAAFIYQCADLTLVTVIIPAPKASIFMADGETIDASNGLVVAFNMGVIGSLTNATGAPAVTFQSGYRLPRSTNPA